MDIKLDELTITIVADGKQWEEPILIVSDKRELAMGKMTFEVRTDSRLHDLFLVDGAPILCTWGLGVSRKWFEIQSNPDETFYVRFGDI